MTGRFLRVKCACSNEQVVFDRPSSVVCCSKCNEAIATPTGGRADVKATVLELLQ